MEQIVGVIWDDYYESVKGRTLNCERSKELCISWMKKHIRICFLNRIGSIRFVFKSLVHKMGFRHESSFATIKELKIKLLRFLFCNRMMCFHRPTWLVMFGTGIKQDHCDCSLNLPFTFDCIYFTKSVYKVKQYPFSIWWL